MADVVLNLVYNDNNARKEVDGLISQLQKLESRSYRIQFDRSSVPAFIKEIDNLTAKLNNIRNIDFRTIGAGIGYGARISGIETYIDKLSESISRARQQMDELAVEMSRLGGSGSEVDDLAAQYDDLARSVETYKDQIAYAKKLHEELTSSHTAEIEQQISDTEKAAQEFEKAQEEKARSAREAAEKIKEAGIEITQGQHQMWRGVEQLVSGVINTITSGWDTFKSVVEAPLNLTGVSSLVSMLEGMEGSLLLDQISSNITGGFSESVERFDILQTFPSVMEAIGFSADQSSASMDRLYQSVLGLPTAFEDIVQTTQYFALVLGDLDKATDLSIAANNAFVASGATSQQITAGMRQLQYLIDGTKLRSTQWYSLIRSMPVALREVGNALGYPDFNAFTADLMAGKVATDDLINSLIDVGFHSEKIAGVVDIMKSRVQASLDNVRNAAKRMGNTMLEALDNVLRQEGGKGIAENIKGVSGVLDHIAQVAAQWISTHGPEIQALIDKFMSIDWASVIPNFFEGLVEFANNALDNIGEYISDIGSLLVDARQFFNDIENSRIVKLLSGGSSFIGGIAQSIAGIGNILAGLKLTSIGKAILASMPGAAGAAGTAGSAGVAGAVGTAGAAGLLSLLSGLAGVVVTSPFIQASYQGMQYVANDVNKTENKKAIAEYSKRNRDAVFEYLKEHPEYTYSGIMEMVEEYNALHRSTDATGHVKGVSNYKERQARYEYLKQFLTGIGLAATPRTGFEDIGVIDVAPEIDYWESVSKALIKLRSSAKEYESPIVDIIERTVKRVDLIKQLQDYYDSAISVIDEKITELQEKRQELLDRIASEPEVLSTSYFEKIYKSGGFFSKQVEESSGYGYHNTTEDLANFYENNLGTLEDWLSGMSEYIDSLEDGETKELAKQYYTELLKNFDIGDAEQVGLLLKNYGVKTPEEVVNEYFLEQARAAVAEKNWQDAIDQALADEYGLEIEEYQAQKEGLEKEESSAIGFVLKGIEEDFEKIQEDYPEVFRYVISSNDELKKAFETALDNLDSSLAVSQINRYYSDLANAVSRGNSELRRRMNLRYYPSWTSPGGQTPPAYATGGYLFAPIGTDTIPAMLTPGEYVQRRAAVEHFGRVFMDRINALDLRGALRSLTVNGYATPYSNGGFIRSDNRTYKDNHAVINQTFNHASGDYGFRRAGRFVRALG